MSNVYIALVGGDSLVEVMTVAMLSYYQDTPPPTLTFYLQSNFSHSIFTFTKTYNKLLTYSNYFYSFSFTYKTFKVSKYKELKDIIESKLIIMQHEMGQQFDTIIINTDTLSFLNLHTSYTTTVAKPIKLYDTLGMAYTMAYRLRLSELKLLEKDCGLKLTKHKGRPTTAHYLDILNKQKMCMYHDSPRTLQLIANYIYNELISAYSFDVLKYTSYIKRLPLWWRMATHRTKFSLFDYYTPEQQEEVLEAINKLKIAKKLKATGSLLYTLNLPKKFMKTHF